MEPLIPKSFPLLDTTPAIGRTTAQQHYRLYTGYVNSYNQLAQRYDTTKRNLSSLVGSDLMSIKVDISFALGSIRNHELYFDCLGTPKVTPPEALVKAIKENFDTFEQYCEDLRLTAAYAKCWVWSAYDLDTGHIFNYHSLAHNGFPVMHAIPILALDLFGHAYLYDHGNERNVYVDKFIAHIAWDRVAKYLQAAQHLHAQRLK
ncbi:MAG: Fe-Mn family superoxide dismutase [Phycisphaerae bacterium]